MITAEEFSSKYTRLRSAMAISDISEMMIEFAKLHVETALKEASEQAKTDVVLKRNKVSFSAEYDKVIDKNSILNSYPLDNIK